MGRGDVNKTMANVVPFVSEAIGLKGWNNVIAAQDEPETNLTGIFAGPLNPAMFVPFYAPSNLSVIGAGGQGVLIKDGLNTSLTFETVGNSVNLTAKNQLGESSGLAFCLLEPLHRAQELCGKF